MRLASGRPPRRGSRAEDPERGALRLIRRSDKERVAVQLDGSGFTGVIDAGDTHRAICKPWAYAGFIP